VKTLGEIKCSGRVSIPCSACVIRHDVPYVVSWNKTYSWQQYHDLYISLSMMVTETLLTLEVINFIIVTRMPQRLVKLDTRWEASQQSLR